MKDAEIISHEGVVTKANGDGVVEVTITAGSACSGCHAQSACGMGSSEKKVISVKSLKSYKPGEIVTVIMEQAQGIKAVIIGYVLPFAVLIAVFIAMTIAHAGELLSAHVSFASLGFYYIVVWLLRERINRKFTFKIKN
jgi:positive regulator of sigma E activity